MTSRQTTPSNVLTADEIRHFQYEGAKAQLVRIVTTFPDLANEISRMKPDTQLRHHMIGRATMSAKKVTVAAATRPHWTQTAEGKRKMAAAQRKAWKTRRAAERGK